MWEGVLRSVWRHKQVIIVRRRVALICSRVCRSAHLGIFLIQHIILRLLVWVLYISASGTAISAQFKSAICLSPAFQLETDQVHINEAKVHFMWGGFYSAVLWFKITEWNLRKKCRKTRKWKELKIPHSFYPPNFEVCWDFVKFPLK